MTTQQVQGLVGPQPKQLAIYVNSRWAVLSSCLLVLAACSNQSRVLEGQEETLEITGPTEHKFHSVLYFPKGTALHYPGYVLALEKAPQDIVGGPKFLDRSGALASWFLNDEVEYFKDEIDLNWNLGSVALLEQMKTDSKAVFISHIMRYSTRTVFKSNPYTFTDHCFVYNSFLNEKVTGAANDSSRVLAWRNCPVTWSPQPSEGTQSMYLSGMHALESLRENLSGDLLGHRFTHILVIVMGWNTAQDEAVRNVNDIAGNLLEAAYEESAQPAKQHAPKEQGSVQETLSHFRPLVIGVTWPSFWSTKLWNLFSYPNKAGDADEIGVSWLNVLLNKSIPAAVEASGSRAKFVVVGHSFGARAATRALFSSPALKTSQSNSEPQSEIDLLVGLQGAVSINRFHIGAGDEGAPYRDFSRMGTQIALTASRHDKAAGGPIFWYDPFGSINSHDTACTGEGWYGNVFECLRAEETSAAPEGRFALWRHGEKTPWVPSSDGPKRVLYIDTSDGVTQFNSPGSGGAAHSDIYRIPMGRLLWKLIRELAPYSSDAE